MSDSLKPRGRAVDDSGCLVAVAVLPLILIRQLPRDVMPPLAVEVNTLKALANSSPGFALKPWDVKGTFALSQL